MRRSTVFQSTATQPGFCARLRSSGLTWWAVAVIVAMVALAWIDGPIQVLARSQSPSFETGPWGRVRISEMIIAPPADLVAKLDASIESPRWNFADTSAGELVDLLTGAGLDDASLQLLIAAARWQSPLNGYTVEPAASFIESLDPEARRDIYNRLALDPQNAAQANAFRHRATHANDWLSLMPVRSATRQRLASMIYANGDTWCFADWATLAPSLDRFERRPLLQALASQPTVRVTLLVRPGDPIDAVARYWDPQGRRGLRDTLARLADQPDGAAVDVLDLLPNYARSRAYTYPTEPDAGPLDSALGFLDEMFTRTPVAAATLDDALRSCRRVESPRMGDLVVFSSAGRAYHVAVYLAADVLFTRNGRGATDPWTLMTIEALREYFPQAHRIDIEFLRCEAAVGESLTAAPTPAPSPIVAPVVSPSFSTESQT